MTGPTCCHHVLLEQGDELVVEPQLAEGVGQRGLEQHDVVLLSLQTHLHQGGPMQDLAAAVRGHVVCGDAQRRTRTVKRRNLFLFFFYQPSRHWPRRTSSARPLFSLQFGSGWFFMLLVVLREKERFEMAALIAF